MMSLASFFSQLTWGRIPFYRQQKKYHPLVRFHHTSAWIDRVYGNSSKPILWPLDLIPYTLRGYSYVDWFADGNLGIAHLRNYVRWSA